MKNFDKIREALEYIDDHLDEPISFKTIAERFHFSAYYFHRIFSVIVGKTVAAHVRDRRLQAACVRLAETDGPVLVIALDCGYDSAQAFSRAFKQIYGLSPSEYRKQGLRPNVTTAQELIMKFTNRLKGGIYLNPEIMKRDAMLIAGTSGDGDKTWEVWNAFEKLHNEKPLANRLSENGYEIRLYDGEKQTVHVGYAVSDESAAEGYSLFRLPASQYASFEVYVANGYDSENNAMNEWLQSNSDGYRERLLNGAHYCVEYYDERFNGSEDGSIVEIWIPVEK